MNGCFEWIFLRAEISLVLYSVAPVTCHSLLPLCTAFELDLELACITEMILFLFSRAAKILHAAASITGAWRLKVLFLTLQTSHSPQGPIVVHFLWFSSRWTTDDEENEGICLGAPEGVITLLQGVISNSCFSRSITKSVNHLTVGKSQNCYKSNPIKQVLKCSNIININPKVGSTPN